MPGSEAQQSPRRLTPVTPDDCDQGLICPYTSQCKEISNLGKYSVFNRIYYFNFFLVQNIFVLLYLFGIFYCLRDQVYFP